METAAWHEIAAPFHCSTSVTVGPATVCAEPTATQKVTEVHDTPYSDCGCVVPVSTLGTVANPPPSHRSISVWVTVLAVAAPTAKRLLSSSANSGPCDEARDKPRATAEKAIIAAKAEKTSVQASTER